jgi:hypothetical protein
MEEDNCNLTYFLGRLTIEFEQHEILERYFKEKDVIMSRKETRSGNLS